MAKIPLTIDKNYCADWSCFEGLRELLQNAKDADEAGHPMTVTHHAKTQTLEISNANVHVQPAQLLILGRSGKTPGAARGQFGEGFVLGCLALLRQDMHVKFSNAELAWTVSFTEIDDAQHPFYGQALLTFSSRKAPRFCADFHVTVTGVTSEIWDIVRPLFLFLDPPAAAQQLTTAAGDILLEPRHKGQVFARGIYVRTFPDLAAGYNLHGLVLDRDRRFVNEWELHGSLSKLWQDTYRDAPTQTAPRIYDMLGTGAPEMSQLEYYGNTDLYQHLRREFVRHHGATAFPVQTIADAQAYSDLQGVPVVVNSKMATLLARAGMDPETLRQQRAGQIEHYVQTTELDFDQCHTLRLLQPLFPALAVVRFSDATPQAYELPHTATLGVDDRLLAAGFVPALRALAALAAAQNGTNIVDQLLAYVATTVGAPTDA